MMKLFLNGEEVACLGYVPGGGSLIQTKYITMDGRLGDLYLYYTSSPLRKSFIMEYRVPSRST